jgi:hypothetical protein
MYFIKIISILILLIFAKLSLSFHLRSVDDYIPNEDDEMSDNVVIARKIKNYPIHGFTEDPSFSPSMKVVRNSEYNHLYYYTNEKPICNVFNNSHDNEQFCASQFLHFCKKHGAIGIIAFTYNNITNIYSALCLHAY